MAGRPKRKADMATLDLMPREHIVSMLEAGQPIARICYALGVGRVALEEWLNSPDNEGLASRARAKAADDMVAESILIADETDVEEVQKARLRVQTRQWVAERWNPSAYAQNKMPSVQVNLSGMRLDALRRIEVVEDISTEHSEKLS
jgi:hypothetical protein